MNEFELFEKIQNSMHEGTYKKQFLMYYHYCLNWMIRLI